MAPLASMPMVGQRRTRVPAETNRQHPAPLPTLQVYKRRARRSLLLRLPRHYLALRSELCAGLQEVLDDLSRRLGLAEEVALHFGAADILQRLHLLLSLDAFRGRHHVEALCEPRNRVHDRKRLGRARDILNERAIDLDLVERKAAQIAQRRIS